MVEVTFDTDDGNFWCSANTQNRQGQTFSISAFEDHSMIVFFFDDRWELSPRDIEFIVDVDYERWYVDGTADGIAISSNLTDAEASTEFVRDLMQGNAVALYNIDERQLGTFSLNGSSAAIAQLVACWEKILLPTDPFQTTRDPF